MLLSVSCQPVAVPYTVVYNCCRRVHNGLTYADPLCPLIKLPFLLHAHQHPKVNQGRAVRQIMVPESLRGQVMNLAHDSHAL